MNFLRQLIRRRRKPPDEPGSEYRIPVLAMTADDGDRRLLSEFAVAGQWDLRFADGSAGAVEMLKQGPPVVILCDRDLPGLDWQAFFERLTASRGDCTLILTSPVYDEYLWDEVVQRGGYDVLCKPLRREQSVSAVNLAWLFARSGSRVRTA